VVGISSGVVVTSSEVVGTSSRVEVVIGRGVVALVVGRGVVEDEVVVVWRGEVAAVWRDGGM